MVVIGLVIALIGFAIMSRPFKIGFGLYLAFLAYYIYLYGGKGGVGRGFHCIFTRVWGGSPASAPVAGEEELEYSEAFAAMILEQEESGFQKMDADDLLALLERKLSETRSGR